MGALYLNGRQIGDDGRHAYGRDDIPRATPRPVDNSALDAGIAELQAAAPGAVHACDLARVAFWQTLSGFDMLERLVPGLTCPPTGERDARRMETMADILEDQDRLLASEARDCRALRIYAAQVRAAVMTEVA